MSSSELIKAITEKNKNISKMNIEDFIRRGELGEKYGFQKAENNLKNIKNLALKFTGYDLTEIPERRLDGVNDILDRVLATLNHIIEYTPEEPKHGTADQLIKELGKNFSGFFDIVTPLMSYLELNKNRSVEIENSAKELVKSMEFMQNEVSEKKSSTIKEADNIIKSLKDAAAESGVTRHSEIFANEAKKHNKLAIYWLLATIGLIIVSIIIAYLVLNLSPSSATPSTYEMVQYSITKIVIFTILYYLIILFVRNYNAHRHNYVVNKHRQNALSTFLTFVDSTKDQETKNAILIQTTQSIFSSQLSGYIKNEGDDTGHNKFIEIIRNASSVVKNK